jgi:long-chain acyl-CoA synthetase
VNLATIIEPHPADAVALISRRKQTTYGQLRDQVASFRGGLAGLGLVPGDRVAIACGNNWYFTVSYLAVLGAGLVAVPLNPNAPTPEISRELATIGARGLIVGPAAKAAIGALDRSELGALEHVIAAAGVDLDGATSMDDLLAHDPAPIADRADDDLAVLMFTSGTAGHPRAAMLTHGNLRSNLEQVQGHEGRRQEASDVSFGVLPTFHIFGLNVVLGLTLFTGATALLVERFDPVSAIEAIEEHGVTIISGAPPMWAAWASLPGVSPDAFRSVRIAASGAAKLPIEVAQLIEDRFDIHLTEGYGLTEASPVVTTAGGTHAPFGSIGTPVSGLDVRLVDPDGSDVLVGDSGELWVKGPNVFQGYWEDPEATAAALDDDGYLHTGDIAVVNDDGYLFLVDRAKDLIIVSGFNVYPAEVEEVLGEHPAIAEVAVVGVAHPYTGEAVKAYVVVEPGMSAEEDDVIDWCSARLARYKCPDKVMFVDEIPHGAGGKVLRRVLR